MKNKTWIYGNFILIIVTFLLLFFLLSDYTNKKWKDTAVENVYLSLSEGTYNLTMTYQAVSDTYLEAYITSNNQEYVIWGAILPAAKGAGSSSTFSFPLEYSVLNNSLGFRCPYVQGEAVQFSEIQIKTAEFPLKQAASIVLYLFTAFLLCFFVKDFRMRFYAEGIWTLSSIFLHPIFVRNLWFLLLYTIGYFIACIIFFNKKNNTVNEDMAAFTFFYAAALLFMEIFTTSSPLFSFNKGCDENIYYAIGHGLANGLHLYTEMFDHKGPFFFFVYMIGYIISPGKYYGIYFIEVIFMAISLFCIYKIAAMFIKKEVAYMAAFSALPLLLNTNYMQTGGSFEQMAVPAMLGMLYFAFFYFSPALPSEISEKKQLVGFFLQGLLTAAILFSKFSITFAWLAVPFFLFLQLLWNKKIRLLLWGMLVYAAGILAILLPVIVIFHIKGNLEQFLDFYFLFNTKYAAVGSIPDTVTRIISTAYQQFVNNKADSILILIGMVGLVFSRRFFNLFGKLAFVCTFVILVGTTYAGSQSYDYYYMIIASFGIFGELFIFYQFQDRLKRIEADGRIVIASVLLFIGLTMYCNNLILQSALFDKEPSAQDVLSQQMELYSTSGDISFFEYDMLERGFCSQAGTVPFVQYFFYPNIDDTVFPDIREAQLSYIADKVTEFVIFQRFRADDYPQLPMLEENYQYIAGYTYDTGETFMLYQRK